ncbi:aldo/keto reductase [Luteirhabdus pelagi]|uniref:aldo/keto reductase n=1 Tax=Luteirhabdus pelagi TaxID=2792783 RepID=UPI001939E853|nr:aldo/keto reductase [Luteirhabdus pelagi]
MKQIQFGKTALEISPLIFGGNVFGWTLNEKESMDMLDQIDELGINCIDTADVYSRWVDGNSGGESEALIGKWMKSRKNRDRFTICTKVGMDMGQGGIDISEKHIVKSVDDSLRRLQTDYIDLYYAHKDDETTPPEETLSAFQKLIEAGKVRYIGASNFSAERLEQSIQTSKRESLPQYRVFQPHYNAWVRKEYEGELEAVCEKYGLGVATYFSLGSGLLTGKYSSQQDIENSSRTDYVKKHYSEQLLGFINVLKEVANDHSSSPAAVSLAWLLHQPTVTAPIASATKTSHLEAIKEAVRMELTITELDRLDAAGQ